MDVGSGAYLKVNGTLTIDPSGKLTVNSGGALTVTDAFSNNSATTDFVIESGGSLITEGSVSGSATVKREIASNLGWHLFSSPVSYQEICDGTFAPLLANFITTPINTWDFYRWLIPCDNNEHWINLRNDGGSFNNAWWSATPSFEVKKGYLVAYGAGFPTSKVFTGTPNTSNQTFIYTDVTSDCSWELAGNPFPSAFDWNLVTGKENLVNGYYYVWNENKAGGAGYEAFLDVLHKTAGVNGKIPSMQGFFIKINPDLAKQFIVPNSSRTHETGTDTWLKEGASVNTLTLTLGNGTNYDDSYILFESNGKIGTDWYDATKMLTMDKKVPQIYTMVSGDQKTLINTMPLITNPITIPVGIVAPADGNYSIKIAGIENFSSLNGLVLEDLSMHVSQNILQNPEYNFSATGNEDAGRFLLHFNGDLSNPNGDNPIKIYSSGATINIFCAAGLQHGRIIMSNMLGQQILDQTLNDQTLNQVTVNAVNGYYIVKVQSDNNVKTAKVYIN